MNSKLLLTISHVILIVTSAASFAAVPPPEEGQFDSLAWKATLKEKPTNGIQMGLYRVQFEKTTLDDILRETKTGEISHQGDASESIYWLCFTNLNSSQVERVWIIANGEMGGVAHFVTNVSAKLIPNGTATNDCPALPKNLLPLSFDNHIWLNSTMSDVHKLGAPSSQIGAWRSYYYEGKVPGICEGGDFDMLNSLILKLRKGRVTSIYAAQVTSC